MFEVDIEKMKRFETLFGLTKKKDVEAFCKDWTITSSEFAELIFQGMAGALAPYKHHRNHIWLEPEHLIPTEAERAAFVKNGVGPLEGKAKTMANKIFTMFEQRKMISVHTFYNPNANHWHMFYFNQRDTDEERNHWVEGSHIHYTHDTFVRQNLAEVYEGIDQQKPKLPKSIHIKYVGSTYESNQSA